MPTNSGVALKPGALRAARLARGWTLRDLSEACTATGIKDVDFGNIARYERGANRPYPRTLLALATALGGKPADFTAPPENTTGQAAPKAA